jgi:hypothetical protein
MDVKVDMQGCRLEGKKKKRKKPLLQPVAALLQDLLLSLSSKRITCLCCHGAVGWWRC